MSDEANSSRVEDILENINGESHELEKPRSRIEEILTNILNGSSIFGKAQSRVEDLLIELADIIESGGSLTDLDNIAFGNNPTVPEEGKITSENLEDIADAINEVASRPVIMVGERQDPITENGTYYPDEGEAWNEVTVDVDTEPSLQSLTATENGTYTPDEGYDGFSDVQVDIYVPPPNLQPLYVGTNGIYTPEAEYEGFSDVTVEVDGGSAAPSLQSLEVFNNGTYTPDDGYDGFDQVEVSIDLGYVTGFSISGTLDDPLSKYPFSIVYSMLHSLWEVINVRPIMTLDATQLGLGTGLITLLPRTNNGSNYILGTGGFVDQSSSMAISVIWDSTGLVSAYAEQNGTISDLSSYASVINTIIYGPDTSR